MTIFSAFVSALALSSSGAQKRAKKVAIDAVSAQPQRPRMLPCDSAGQCPRGSVCMKVFTNYGLCVLEDDRRRPT